MSTYTLNLYRPFYVEKSVHRIEEGDIGHGTEYAVKKEVFWQTDLFGYRTSDIYPAYDIIVIGDSNIAGSSLTQNDTFTHVLNSISRFKAYPYAPSNVNKFISEKRFSENPPKIVILESIESNIFQLPPLQKSKEMQIAHNMILIEKIEDYLDSILKFSFYRSQVAKVKKYYSATPFLVSKDTKMLFSESTLVFNRAQNLKYFNRSLDIIEEYKDYFSEKDIHFIFLPLPDKETAYSDYLPQSHTEYRNNTLFIPNLIKELNDRGVNVIDIYHPFIQNKEEVLFQLDDTHWNSKGVRLAADVTLKTLFNATNTHAASKDSLLPPMYNSDLIYVPYPKNDSAQILSGSL